jgi:hypothetical protein
MQRWDAAYHQDDRDKMIKIIRMQRWDDEYHLISVIPEYHRDDSDEMTKISRTQKWDDKNHPDAEMG